VCPVLRLLAEDGVGLCDQVENQLIGILKFGRFFELIDAANLGAEEKAKPAERKDDGCGYDHRDAKADGVSIDHGSFPRQMGGHGA